MVLDLIKAAILGTVQGITEFLPVSSTGHLILVEDLLNVDQDRYGLPFDAALHLGTLVSVLCFFGMRWVRLAQGGLRVLRERSLADDEGRLAWLLVIGTIPAAVIGLALEDLAEDAFRSMVLVASMLIAFSAVFILAEAFGRRQRAMTDMSWKDAVIVGFAQALALVPGVSRSGATISAGLFRDVERREAASFAFLLSAPIIAGAGLKQSAGVVRDFADGRLGGEDAAFFAVGFAVAAIVGYASMKFLLHFLSSHRLNAFAAYRVGLGLLVFAMLGWNLIAMTRLF